MEDFTPRLTARAALQLYLFLEAREEQLDGGSAELYSALRAYLYERLSIEDMESPETLLARFE
jgi:hypothetical protein